MYQTLIKPFYQDAKKFILDTFFPVKCLICDKEGSFICDDCKLKLARLDHQHCIVCQKPSVGGVTHPYCQTPFGADGLVSVFDYHNENIKNIIIKGKYSFIPRIYEIFGSLIAKEIQTDYSDLFLSSSFCLTPVPLSSSRKRWRGFNQAEVLCQTISKELGLSVVNTLKRKKLTKVQKDIQKKEQRAKNMEGAFALSLLSLKGEGLGVRGKNLILVDDVVTTGSTLSEAIKVLKRNGANKVWCLTIARD